MFHFEDSLLFLLNNYLYFTDESLGPKGVKVSMMGDSKQEKSAKQRILLVDDECNVRNVLYWALKDAGYETCFASSSQQAIEILKQKPNLFDFVISDIEMPGGSGVEVLKYVNSMEKPPLTVMISGHYEFNYSQAKAMGASTMVNKPFSIGVLLTALKEAVSLRAGA